MGKRKQKNVPRRQHTIPRMLLKRFASRVEGEEFYTWQFRRDAKPFETNIKNSSVETYFYGKPINGVEGSFGVVETRHSATLDRVLLGDNPNEHEDDLRELVWTLAIRTGNIRRNIGDLFVGGVDEMVLQADPDTSGGMLSAFLDGEFDELLDQMVAKLPAVPARALRISLERRPALRAKFRRLIDIYSESNDVAGAFRTLLVAVRSQTDFGKLTEEAHIRSLERLIEGDHVPETFRPEHWHIVRAPARSVILGDGTCFAVRGDAGPGHLLRYTRDWSEIYLPISHEAVLVANRSEQDPRYTIDQINHASASLSYDQFFAAENVSHHQDLMPLIHTGVATLSPEEMRDSVRGSWKGQSSNPGDDDSA